MRFLLAGVLPSGALLLPAGNRLVALRRRDARNVGETDGAAALSLCALVVVAMIEVSEQQLTRLYLLVKS